MLRNHIRDTRIRRVVSSDLEILVCNRQGPGKRPVAERVGDNLECERRVLVGKKIRLGSCCIRNFVHYISFDRRPSEKSFLCTRNESGESLGDR